MSMRKMSNLALALLLACLGVTAQAYAAITDDSGTSIDQAAEGPPLEGQTVGENPHKDKVNIDNVSVTGNGESETIADPPSTESHVSKETDTESSGVIQRIADEPMAPQDAPSAPTQLNDQFDATNYYGDQESRAWRNNAVKLAEIDEGYRDAVTELSRENSLRNQEIFANNSAAHKRLAEQGLPSADKAAETQRIQADTTKERQELAAWYALRLEEITTGHATRRAAQIAATNELVKQIGAERVATLQRLLDGPIDVASLPVMTFPDENGDVVGATSGSGGIEGDSNGLDTGTGGIDVAGSVPVDTPGDELVASENAERFALYERLFFEEKVRRERAEEEAASQLRYIQTSQARAHTAASASSRQPNCETNPDADGDGVLDIACGGADCDDRNPDRYPGNTEVGNYLDEDCDPETLGDDGDGDGYISAHFCNGDNCGADCDDARPSVHPGAIEVCNFVDDNCDADVDNGVTGLKFLDRDGDLHGDPDDSLQVCAQTGSYTDSTGTFNWLSTVGNDCDDTDPGRWEGCGQQ